MKKQEIIITNNPEDNQLCVKLFPKRKINVRKTDIQNKLTSEIDIIELCLKDVDGNDNPIQMTPDEALEIAGLLNTAVGIYFKNFDKEYIKNFMLKIKELNKIQKKVK